MVFEVSFLGVVGLFVAFMIGHGIVVALEDRRERQERERRAS